MKIPSSSQQYRKRLGRGSGSGHGKTSGKGHKGQRARSGPKIGPGFEGGQMPIYRRLPKFGFKNPFPKVVQVINLETLERLPKGLKEITPQGLYEKGVLKKLHVPLKILAKGKLTRSLHIQAHSFSAAAKEQIEKAGGKVEVIIARKAGTTNK